MPVSSLVILRQSVSIQMILAVPFNLLESSFCMQGFLGNISQNLIFGQKFYKSGEMFEKFDLFRAPFLENNLQVFLKFQRNDYRN